jgi:hypothetical protein
MPKLLVAIFVFFYAGIAMSNIRLEEIECQVKLSPFMAQHGAIAIPLKASVSDNLQEVTVKVNNKEVRIEVLFLKGTNYEPQQMLRMKINENSSLIFEPKQGLYSIKSTGVKLECEIVLEV